MIYDNTMNESLGQKIGAYIKYQRDKRKLTITELAERSRLTSAYISRLEQGDYESPSLEAIEQLAKALRMPLQAMLNKSGALNEPIELPDLAYYLHEKFQFPPEAIEDIELFIEFVKKKHQKAIKRYQAVGKKFWRDR